MYLLGLDIGTTNWKANLYDMKGKLVISVSAPTPTRKDSRGHSYYDPEVMWKTFCSLIRQAVKKAGKPDAIKALSFASMAEAGLLVDENGEAVSHIIPWFDQRSMPQTEKLITKLGRERVFGITGINLAHIFSISKISWLKENEPKAFKKAAKWLCAPDYLVKKLTGEWATDHSIANRTCLFDIKKRTWSKTMLDAIDIKESFLPKSYPSGTVAGLITKKASLECGLAVGTKVALGGHDHVVGSLGVGLLSPGSVLDSIGTSESICAPIDNVNDLKKYYKSGFSFGCYTYGNMYHLMSGLYYSGGMVDWLGRQYYSDCHSKNELYKIMFQEAEASVPGSKGLFVYPHWQGIGAPYGVRKAKGMMIGFSPEINRGDICNAALEGLSYEFRLLVENVEKTLGIKVKDVTVIGGGAKNKLWLKRKADITGRNMVVPHIPESVCFGAALLGAMGAGLIKDPMELIKNFKKETIRVNEGLNKFYSDEYKNKYLDIYKRVLPYWKK